VDIGTSDFDTCVDFLKPGQRALLVEPLKYYLDRLPDGPGITKVNAALSSKKGRGKMYYVKEELIHQYGLPNWIRGCNSFNKEHPTVVKLFEELKLPLDLITCERVKVLTFWDLVQKFNIHRIEFVKIDTEGHDHIILKEILECMRGGLKISQIRVEYNPFFGNTGKLDKLINGSNYKQAYLIEDNAVIQF